MTMHKDPLYMQHVARAKNNADKRAADRAAPILKQAGISKADFQRAQLAARITKPTPKKHRNFIWTPDRINGQ